MQIKRSIATLGIGILAVTAAAGASEAGGVGNCYVRADVGYGWSVSNNATARITPGFGTIVGPVQDADLGDSWFGEVGIGCSLIRHTFLGGSIKDEPQSFVAPTGLRGDITFAFHGERDFFGVPLNPPNPPPGFEDPAHAKIRTNTLMFNAYYDFPRFHAFTPYIGVGIGLGFIDLHDVHFVDNNGVTRLGNRDATNVAWSLMAGVAVDVVRGVKLDLGYRYINLGDIGVSNGAVGYSLRIKEVSEHQLKAGVRVPLSFGG